MQKNFFFSKRGEGLYVGKERGWEEADGMVERGRDFERMVEGVDGG